MHVSIRQQFPRRKGEGSSARPDVSVAMPTTSWSGTFEPCARRVLELLESSACDAEFIVVLDGEPQAPPAWLMRRGVRVVSTGVNRGPAAARNRAVAEARAELVLFVDADVELERDVLDRACERMRRDPGLDALFGSYDDEPAAPGTASQFRNLLHHHTHVAHPGRAATFWAGCGAMRVARFHAVGGFDERYRRPSIEDIELGVRVTAAGGRIEVDPGLRCKHHKRWTLRSMVHTDVACRAAPWTELMLRTHRLPASLATDWRNRASGALALAAVAAAIGSASAAATSSTWTAWAGALAAACLVTLFAIHLDFYRLCFRKRGAGFAGAAFALHAFFFVYSTSTFGIVVCRSFARRAVGRSPRTAGPLLDARAVPAREGLHAAP